jgi:probable DNA repair protein
VNSNDRCVAHLESGGLVLAPDLRRARILRRLHDRAQAAAGRQVWPTAQVLPLEAWLASSWARAADERPDLPAILSPPALRWLWWREVERDAPQLLDPADLGARARASWLKLRSHGGDLASVARWPLTRDQQAFLGWARRVERELAERGACDGGDIARRLVESSALPPPGPPILLAGFRRESPAEAALFTALASAGHPVERLSPGTAAGPCAIHRAADRASERTAMVAWLAERIAEAPAGLHAVIVPDLDADRGALERALAAVLQPSLEIPGGQGANRLFDLAGGHPLQQQPVADDALTAIACAAGSVGWAEASRLLLSTHVAGTGHERDARVAADLALRAGTDPVRMTGSRLAALAAAAGANAFGTAARAATAALSGPRKRSAGDWAEAFGAALAAWQWPGEALGSREYQAAQRLRELLRELASLASVAPAMDVGEAIAELRRLAAAPFQPESGEPAAFVLDAYDDPGVQLDSLWVAGLTAGAWPRPAAVDPLLPIEIQRALAMPLTSPEASVADALDVTARWRSRTGRLALSWPHIESDTDADPSPLLPADVVDLPAPALPRTRERLTFAARRLEPILERPLPPLASPQAPGGAKLLQLQAQCPFRAFAELRLRATPLEEPEAGFDRKLRGIVLHRALEDLWRSFGSQAALASLDRQARADSIEAAVAAALARESPAGAGERTVAIEGDWQREAIARLLEADLARPPVTVVETERALALAIGGLELRLRLDRGDRVGDERVVIDYKTGGAKASAWRGARMDAPQLPLYAVLHPDRPTGIAFASVGATRARYVGVGRDGATLPGMRAAEKFALTEDEEKGFDWAAITAHWRAWLERLAADFAGGRADVDPKLGADTCRLCHLGALCRVEAAAQEPAEEGDDGD